jgi:hypothetical protein
LPPDYYDDEDPFADDDYDDYDEETEAYYSKGKGTRVVVVVW